MKLLAFSTSSSDTPERTTFVPTDNPASRCAGREPEVPGCEPRTSGAALLGTPLTLLQDSDPGRLIAPAPLLTGHAGHVHILEFNDLTRPFHAGRAVPVDAERFAGSRPGQHLEQMDLRFEPDLSIFGGNDVARVAGWMRPVDLDERVTVPCLICAADFMPPSMAFRTDQPVEAASVDFSVQLLCGDPAAAISPEEFLYGEMRSSISAEGFSVEDGTFWSPAGQPLATSRQLRLAGV